MGVGKRGGSGSAVYLNVAAGALWQRKDKGGNPVSKDHEDYEVETYLDSKQVEQTRSGLRYSFIEGTVKKFWFYGGQYGEMINIQVDDGEQVYTVSAATDNRFGVDLMRMLISFDPEKDVDIAPYDFVGDNGGRNRGCSIKQEGKKVVLLPNPKDPMEIEYKSSEELKKMGTTNLGKTKRTLYFANQSEEIKQMALEAVPQLLSEKDDSDDNKEESTTDKVADKKEKSVTKTTKKSDTSLLAKHKKRLSAYAQEEYSRELPDDLTDEEIEEWYKLSIADQELPFDEYDQRNDASDEDNNKEDDSQDNTEADDEGKSAVQKLKDKLEQRNKNKK